jgi:hypothetical protein
MKLELPGEKLKKSSAREGQSASELISNRIAELGDWRGATLSPIRKLIKEADPDAVVNAADLILTHLSAKSPK